MLSGFFPKTATVTIADAPISSSTSVPIPQMASYTLFVDNDSERSFGMSINAKCVVCNMSPDGLAKAAGISLGDRLISFNGINIRSEDTLFAAMRAVPHGDKCQFVVSRVSQLPDEGNSL